MYCFCQHAKKNTCWRCFYEIRRHLQGFMHRSGRHNYFSIISQSTCACEGSKPNIALVISVSKLLRLCMIISHRYFIRESERDFAQLITWHTYQLLSGSVSGNRVQVKIYNTFIGNVTLQNVLNTLQVCWCLLIQQDHICRRRSTLILIFAFWLVFVVGDMNLWLWVNNCNHFILPHWEEKFSFTARKVLWY